MKCFCTPQSKRLAAKRAKRGMTLKQVAEQMGVSVKTVWSWEAGTPIPERRLEQIAKVLGTSAKYIRTGSNYQDPDFWSLIAAIAVQQQRTKPKVNAPTDVGEAQRGQNVSNPTPAPAQPTTRDLSKMIGSWRGLIAQEAGVDISRVEVAIRHD